ncbi:MAG: protein translocase subunit SecF [Candidatus Uhrbacteria bacterium]|nr:protein translocase subunit SecF [Candidatus Uhrbacteria bacterium]
MKLNVITLRLVWYVLSGLMIGLSIAFLALWGLKQGIDFTGGSLYVARFDSRPSSTELEQILQTANLHLGSVVIQPVGDQDMQLRLRNLNEEEHQKLFQALKKKYPEVIELRFDAIGPVIGEELRNKSIRGLVIVLVAIMLYVAYVFRKVSAPVQSWKYGLVTIFTAFHDVIVPVGVFAFLGHYYGVEIGTPFVAAILTIMGYSITDTIVVMDRIRENLQKTSGTFEEIVSASVRQTYFRSFSTSMTTLLTLFAIHFFGGESLRDFTLALIIGIAVGTYSSIFIASPLLVTWNKWTRRKR